MSDMRARPCEMWVDGRYDGCGHSWPPAEIFSLFTIKTRNVLLRGGYHTQEAIEAATDEELLAVRGLGLGALREIRAASGPGATVSVCPTCGGSGKVIHPPIDETV